MHTTALTRRAAHTVSMPPTVGRFNLPKLSWQSLSSNSAPSCRAFHRCPRARKSKHVSQRLITAEAGTTEWYDLELKHVVESQQFSQAALAKIFDTASEMENIKRGTPEAMQLQGYIMSTLFYEPSTRTRLSFESAMSRLGGTVLSTESAGEYSSAAKGETLEGPPSSLS